MLKNLKKCFLKILFLIISISLFGCTNNDQNQIYYEQNDDIFYTNEGNSESFNGLELYMFPLGVDGDCSLIRFGDIDILIDAGGSRASQDSIIKKLNYYVEDHIIEYFIFSHPDEDHIINYQAVFDFSIEGLAKIDNYLEQLFIIDFDSSIDNRIDPKYKETVVNLLSNSPNYMGYKCARDIMVSEHKYKHYSASQFISFEGKEPIINQTLIISSSAEGNINDLHTLKLTILDNSFYYMDNDADISDSALINSISVCVLFEFNGKKILFTGDLEEFDSSSSYSRFFGESNLVELNPSIENIDFYKAAHHGSNTSNSEALLDFIRPKYIGISAVLSDSTLFKFPRQQSLNQMLIHTDRIGIVEIKKDSDSKVENFHGILKYRIDMNGISSFNSIIEGKEKLIRSIYNEKDFYSLRNIPFTMYALSGLKTKMEESNELPANTDCFYIKMGLIDIIFNPGCYLGTSKSLTDKIKYLCNDGVIEHLIISENGSSGFSLLLGDEGILKNDYFKEITNVYIPNPDQTTSYSVDIRTINQKFISSEKVKNINKIYYTDTDNLTQEYEIEFDTLGSNVIFSPKLVFLKPSSLLIEESLSSFAFANRLYCYFDLSNKLENDGNTSSQTFKYLNLGTTGNADTMLDILQEHSELKNNVNFMSIPYMGKDDVYIKDIMKFVYSDGEPSTKFLINSINTNYKSTFDSWLTRFGRESFKYIEDIYCSQFYNCSNIEYCIADGDIGAYLTLIKEKSDTSSGNIIHSLRTRIVTKKGSFDDLSKNLSLYNKDNNEYFALYYQRIK